MIARSDRIEPSKNIVRGFLAYDRLLEARPGLRGRTVFVAMLYPSRQTMPEYLAYANEIEQVVARVNERWATRDWSPILLDERDDFPRSIAAMQRYDVLLVNPIKDGLNLVAKEGPAVNRRDGLLCLSREAGAYEELRTAVIPVHPYDLDDAAGALDRALATPLDERAADRETAAETGDRPHTLRLGQRPGRARPVARLLQARQRRGQQIREAGRTVDERVDRRGEGLGHLGRPHADPNRTRQPAVALGSGQRRERRKITGVVTGERADREPLDQRVDRGAFVDRDRGAQLHCEPGPQLGETMARGQIGRDTEYLVGAIWNRAPMQRDADTGLAFDQHSREASIGFAEWRARPRPRTEPHADRPRAHHRSSAPSRRARPGPDRAPELGARGTRPAVR